MLIAVTEMPARDERPTFPELSFENSMDSKDRRLTVATVKTLLYSTPLHNDVRRMGRMKARSAPAEQYSGLNWRSLGRYIVQQDTHLYNVVTFKKFLVTEPQ